MFVDNGQTVAKIRALLGENVRFFSLWRKSRLILLNNFKMLCKQKITKTGVWHIMYILRMILRHKLNLILLHNRKTEKSTIKLYINPYMGPHDIQIGAWSDAFMNGGRVNTRLVYDCLQCLALKPVRSLRLILNVLRPALSPTTYSGKRTIPKLLNRLQKTRYHYKNPGHPTATEIKQDFPEEWEHYWSFCFVRNPFKKAVSDYLWRRKLTGAEQVSFREFMERVEDPLREDSEGIVPFPRTNWPIYTINDSVAVDFVG